MTKAGQAAVKVNKAKGTQIPVVYCIQSILSVNLSIKVCRERIGVKFLNQIIYSAMLACVPWRQPSTRLQRLQALVGDTDENASAAGPPSKPEEHHRDNTFFTSLDKVLAEIENQFSGNDQDVLCALGDITKSVSPTSDSFDLVAGYYNFDKELLQADQRLFNRFKKIRAKNQ